MFAECIIGMQQSNRRNVETSLDAPFYPPTWVTQLSLGTPPQSLFVTIDTGSADLSVETQQCSSCNAIVQFAADSSTSLQNISCIGEKYVIVMCNSNHTQIHDVPLYATVPAAPAITAI